MQFSGITPYHFSFLPSVKVRIEKLFNPLFLMVSITPGVARGKGHDVERFSDEGRKEKEEEAHVRDLQTTQAQTRGTELMWMFLINVYF